MAIYGLSQYGTALYGAADVKNLVLKYIKASASDATGNYFNLSTGQPVFNQLTLFWSFLNGTSEYTQADYRILRSIRGFATSAYDLTSTVISDLMTITAAAEYSMVDTSVVPGRHYYYTVFLSNENYVEGSPELGPEWIPLGRVSFRTPSDHESFERLINSLPPYMTSPTENSPNSTYGMDVLGVRDASIAPNSPYVLPRFLAGISWVTDSILTDIDHLMRMWSPLEAPAETLLSLAQTLGLPDTKAVLGDASVRALLSSHAEITGYRGTERGIVSLVSALTSIPARVSVGKNLFLDTEQASATGVGTSTWGGDYNALSAVGTSGTGVTSPANLAHVSGIDFATDNTSEACFKLTRVNGGAVNIRLAGGVANSSIVASGGFAKVTTVGAHGLAAGDRIQISGATTAGFNTVYTVVQVESSYRYTVASSLTSSLSGTTDSGRTTSESIPTNNSFAITQGIPLPISGSFSAACDTTNNSKIIVVPDPSLVQVGMRVSGTGIPAGTSVAGVYDDTIILSANATATQTGVSLTFAAVYVLSFKAYSDAVTSTTATANVEWFDKAGNRLDTSTVTGVNGVTITEDTWAVYPALSGTNGQITAPTGARFAVILLAANFVGTGTNNLYLDKFNFCVLSGSATNTPAADLVYEEPRTLFIDLEGDGARDATDAYLRTNLIERTAAVLVDQLYTGSPYRVAMAPGIVTESGLGTYTLGASMSVTLEAVTENSVTWSLSRTGSLPTGLTLSSGGVLSGTPTSMVGVTYPETYSIGVLATDANGLVSEKTFTFTLES